MRFNSWVAWELGAVAGCGCWRLVRVLGAIYFKPWGFMRINSWDSWESVVIIGFIIYKLYTLLIWGSKMYFPCYHNQGGEWGFAHFIWVFGIEIFIWGIYSL